MTIKKGWEIGTHKAIFENPSSNVLDNYLSGLYTHVLYAPPAKNSNFEWSNLLNGGRAFTFSGKVILKPFSIDGNSQL